MRDGHLAVSYFGTVLTKTGNNNASTAPAIRKAFNRRLIGSFRFPYALR